MDDIALPRIDPSALPAARRVSQLLVGYRPRLDLHTDEAVALLAQLNPLQLADFWSHQGVPVRAIQRARSLDVEHDEWDAIEARLRQTAEQTAAVQELISLQVTRTLEREGIRAVSLKGPAMARRLYGDLAVRYPSADIDLLVPTHELRRGSQVLEQLGWAEADEPTGEAADLPEWHVCHDGPEETPSIELHWRVQWYEPEAHSKLILERSSEDDGIILPSPTDHLSILLLCFARDGFHRLRLASDIAAWWETNGPVLGNDASAEFARGPLARPLSISAQAAAAVVGTPMPASPLRGPASRLAVGLALADMPRHKRRVYSQVALVDVLSAPQGERRRRLGASWLRSPEVLASRHPHLARPGLLPALRVASAARTASDLPRLIGAARAETQS